MVLMANTCVVYVYDQATKTLGYGWGKIVVTVKTPMPLYIQDTLLSCTGFEHWHWKEIMACSTVHCLSDQTEKQTV